MSITATATSGVLGSNVHLLDVRPRAGDVRDARRLVANLRRSADTSARAAVFENLVDVVANGEPADYERTVALSLQIGRQRMAELQDEFDSSLGSGPHQPFATAAIIRLARGAQLESVLIRSGRSSGAAHRVATGCAEAAFWLLMVDIDPSRAVPLPGTPLDLALILERRGVNTWRQILANVALQPWGPTPLRLANLARAAGLPIAAEAVERCACVYQERVSADERSEIAKEIRRLVAVSGCSQRVFAENVGTSAPRLSTYVNGGVTPSATMMLRIRRQSAALAHQRGLA